jgi:carbon storage regulator
MLVLSRKTGESIVIDGAIKVQVLEVKGNAVRLGIDAPKEIPVYRSELCERIRENEMPPAASTGGWVLSVICPKPGPLCPRP